MYTCEIDASTVIKMRDSLVDKLKHRTLTCKVFSNM